MKEKLINWLIRKLKPDTNQISDGLYTFGELYERRTELWIALINRLSLTAWKSRKHSDGSEWKNWFLLGYGFFEGEQITYHLPIEYWDRCHVPELKKAPPWDGHSPEDVLERIRAL